MIKKAIYIGIIGTILFSGLATFATGLETKNLCNYTINKNEIDTEKYDQWFKGFINDFSSHNSYTTINVIIGFYGGRGGFEFKLRENVNLYSVTPEDLGLTEEDHGKFQWFTALSH